jgi:hypothetical protein
MQHTTEHHITFIDDDELPSNQDFAFLDCEDDGLWLVLKRSRLTPHVLEDAWETFRRMVG